MSKLSTAQRKKMPASEFAGPNRSYPVPDKTHAANAKARASMAAHEGIISAAEKARIDMKANRVLGKRASASK